MFKVDWDAVRAYASPVILTILALFALWKDSKDYKKLAKEEKGRGLKRTLKRHAILILGTFTLITLLMTLLDIHSTRRQVAQDKADAQTETATRDNQIADLRAAVKSGNDVLGQQRKDFLGQFSEMSNKVTMLQTEVKTADLKEEASQLRGELEATRKSLEIPKATLSFSFWEDSAPTSNLASLNMEDGGIKVRFSVVNGSDTDALEGIIVFVACDGCKIKETSPGFVKMVGQSENQRNFDFQHVFANSRTQQLEVTVVPPLNSDSFQVGMRYRCRTCIVIKSDQPIPPNDLGTVLIGPHWKSNMNINKISTSKK